MTIPEFSSEFDILYNNITSSQSPGLDEYEKSVFLTREEENIVTALYTGADSYGGFELTEQMRRCLDSLLVDDTLLPVTEDTAHIVPGSNIFSLPEKLWYIVYEAAGYGSDSNVKDCIKSDTAAFPVEVVPVTYDEFHRIKKDPFRGPNQRRALRLDAGTFSVALQNSDTGEQSVIHLRNVEIVSQAPLNRYYVKYIRHPKPIILADLDGVTINNESAQSDSCELHESLHRIILDSAVKAAKNSLAGGGPG